MSVENNSGQVKQLFSVLSQESAQGVARLDSAIIEVSTNVQTVDLANVSGTAGYAYFRNVSVSLASINGTLVTNNASIVLGPMDGTNLISFAQLLSGEPAVAPLSKTVQLGVKLQTLSAVETNSLWNHRLHYAINGR
jgi:hypothetical protein